MIKKLNSQGVKKSDLGNLELRNTADSFANIQPEMGNPLMKTIMDQLQTYTRVRDELRQKHYNYEEKQKELLKII